MTDIRYFYHSDHLGSSSMLTDEWGDVYQTLSYMPFGEVLVDLRQDEDIFTPYQFNAKELDEETGLNYYVARYYNSLFSFFITSDPLYHLYPHMSSYAYCLNNPIRFIDPDGRAAWDVTRQWSRSDIANFGDYAKNKIQEFRANGVKDDCANFAIRLIVGYASENGLPLTLQNRWGKTYDASSDDFTSTNQYLNATRAGIQAADLPSNSYGIEQSQTQSGDFEVMQYTQYKNQEVNWQHVVIFENINEKNVNNSSIVWGNPGTDQSGTVLSNGSRNYPRLTQPEGTSWTILSGNLNSRWNVLNPANMQNVPMQAIPAPPIPLLQVNNQLNQ